MLAALAMAWPVAAYESTSARSASLPGFTFAARGDVRVLVVEQEIKVGEQTAAGLSRPHADWTDAARRALGAAVTDIFTKQKMQLIALSATEGEGGALVHDYRKLFDAVAQSVISYKLLPDDRLPTKSGRFDWTLGPGVAELAQSQKADYALFYGTTDGYASASRARIEALGTAFGADIDAGEHRGYAGLVDLKTGDLIWLKVDARMRGDVRTAEGAKRRAGQLFDTFPKRGPASAGKRN